MHRRRDLSPGICLSRGLAEAVAERLRTSALDLYALGDLHLHISGCPNSCGRHLVADIGLSGASRRINDHPLPHYTVQVGGHVEAGQTRLGEPVGQIPARNVPDYLADLLSAFAASEQVGDFGAYLAAGGRQMAADLISAHTHVPEFAADPAYYQDWGAAIGK